MKLIRFGKLHHEKPGIQFSDTRIDVSAFGEDYDENFFATGGIGRLTDWFKINQSTCKVIDNSVRLGCPIKKPSKIVCVGLNYAKHAAESGMELPKEPVIFFKSTTAIVGPYDDLVLPKGSNKTDWEVELAVVIGKRASYVKKENVFDHVAGYVLHNDYSEREYQLERGGQWVKGKSSDTFAPIGPYLVTKEEIKDPNKLNLWLKVNGELKQNGNTSDFVFNIETIVSYISEFMTLLPGDIISTGTPAGVGMGLRPPQYLRPGDMVELSVEGLGISKQNVRASE
ncbi:fumarylacetoacetate hydrolase family protein [Namhaeicola litoreus]|uniref:Fumarylacetoacetate hydrolase family protein n=1 Tax=Namhaeicola litoreus TaxID=1052145 RepID=A0ABW3Y2X6_9FLAO